MSVSSFVAASANRAGSSETSGGSVGRVAGRWGGDQYSAAGVPGAASFRDIAFP